MKSAIKKIDRALKSLNQLENSQKAEQFLVSSSPLHKDTSNESHDFHGALLVRSLGTESLSLGIYLNKNVTTALTDVKKWDPNAWSQEQVKAVTVATEEVSHFHYLLANANVGKPVSQFELELQAEIDKFMLLFFALEPSSEEPEKTFEILYTMLFENFHFKQDLSEAEKERYYDANNAAKTFVAKCKSYLEEKDFARALKLHRQFYRMGLSEKVSLTLRR